MSEDAAKWVVILVSGFIGAIIGFFIGWDCCWSNWSARIVDNPDDIAQIRSAVILERQAERLQEDARLLKRSANTSK